MNVEKVLFLVFLVVISLCIVNTYPVKAQEIGTITIQSDGSILTSTSAEVPIEINGNIYTFTDNINNYYLLVEHDSIVIDGAGYELEVQGEEGIDLSSRINVTVRDLQVGFATYGIYLWNATRITITGNTMTKNFFGI